MALNLSTLFTRLGHHAGGLNEENTAVGATLTARANTVFADYTSTNGPLVDNIFSNRDVARGSFDQIKSYWQGLSQSTLIQMIIDGTVYNPTTLLEALQYLRLEMIAQSASIDDPSLSSSLTAGSSNVGNGSGVPSVFLAPYAKQNDYILQETITLTCTADGYPGGGATAGQEVFQFLGEASAVNLAWDWPAGSAANGTITVFDPSVDSIITNASWDNWPTATAAPTDWSLGTGSFNTSIVRTSTTYRGAYALTFVGQAVAQNTAIYQAISIDPGTAYQLQIQMRSDGSVAAGVIQIALVDVDNAFAVITDAAGNNLELLVTCSALTSSYAPQKATFITPTSVPTNVAIQIKASTAITNTEVIYMDDLGLRAATELYTGGGYLSLFAGSIPYKIGDTFSWAITNNRTASTFVSYLDNVFDLKNNRILIPSSGAPTISNALIT